MNQSRRWACNRAGVPACRKSKAAAKQLNCPTSNYIVIVSCSISLQPSRIEEFQYLKAVLMEGNFVFAVMVVGVLMSIIVSESAEAVEEKKGVEVKKPEWFFDGFLGRINGGKGLSFGHSLSFGKGFGFSFGNGKPSGMGFTKPGCIGKGGGSGGVRKGIGGGIGGGFGGGTGQGVGGGIGNHNDVGKAAEGDKFGHGTKEP